MSHNKERADAVRNRQAILDAALVLFAEAKDPAALTMSAVAAAAGVGKGTLFRRFGDRAGLLRAVFDVQVEQVAQAIATGPSPLGPDTPPMIRIPAILRAIVDLKLDNRSLAQAVEALAPAASSSPFVSERYSYIEDLLKQQLAELLPQSEVVYTAHAMLGGARMDLLDYLSAQEGLTDEEIRQGLDAFVHRLLRDGP
ncbi:TetR/AcrR family transcriptional regulator [Paenibacillus sp. 1P07SE]|uniref:TetR/AcrR family transcriptional regulator n=1 Tax=Paenibacillus sp. 1P07SE TaxID=3132209 RepID=UPI0039A5F38D